ncbi:MAG: Flp family type IVb pilin [Brevundimonas sp.]|uniref:Flp family type IVb pilin n=1 Tax=Brevundimonas sp. TaxID=1871086 RepID=UPI004034323A
MRAFLTRFQRDESGATAIEYGLIISLIFLAIVGSLTIFGNTSSGLFNRAMDAIRTGMGG